MYVLTHAQAWSCCGQTERLTATSQDLCQAERLLDPNLPCDPEDDVPAAFLDGLRRLVGCDDVTLQVMGLDRRYVRLQESSDEPEPT